MFPPLTTIEFFVDNMAACQQLVRLPLTDSFCYTFQLPSYKQCYIIIYHTTDLGKCIATVIYIVFRVPCMSISGCIKYWIYLREHSDTNLGVSHATSCTTIHTPLPHGGMCLAAHLRHLGFLCLLYI